MSTVIPLDESPFSFKPLPGNPTTRKLKNSVVVFSRKDTPKALLQIRMNFQADPKPHVEIINVWLDGEQAKTIADALLRHDRAKEVVKS